MKKITIQNKIATLAILGSLILGSVPVFAQTESTPQESYIGAKMGWRANNRSQLKNEIPNDIRDARGEIRATQEEIKDNRDANKVEIRNLKTEARVDIINAEGKNEIKNIREEVKKDIKESRASFKEEQKEKIQSLRESVRFMIVKELSFAYSHLNNLSIRVGVKLEEMKANGVDVVSADALLINAKESLAKALVSIEKIKSILGGDQTNKETLRAEVKLNVDDVKIQLQSSRQSLKEVIDFIKESSQAGEKRSDSQ